MRTTFPCLPRSRNEEGARGRLRNRIWGRGRIRPAPATPEPAPAPATPASRSIPGTPARIPGTPSEPASGSGARRPEPPEDEAPPPVPAPAVAKAQAKAQAKAAVPVAKAKAAAAPVEALAGEAPIDMNIPEPLNRFIYLRDNKDKTPGNRGFIQEEGNRDLPWAYIIGRERPWERRLREAGVDTFNKLFDFLRDRLDEGDPEPKFNYTAKEKNLAQLARKTYSSLYENGRLATRGFVPESRRANQTPMIEKIRKQGRQGGVPAG